MLIILNKYYNKTSVELNNKINPVPHLLGSKWFKIDNQLEFYGLKRII